jgi:hypothetical protein
VLYLFLIVLSFMYDRGLISETYLSGAEASAMRVAMR